MPAARHFLFLPFIFILWTLYFGPLSQSCSSLLFCFCAFILTPLLWLIMLLLLSLGVSFISLKHFSLLWSLRHSCFLFFTLVQVNPSFSCFYSPTLTCRWSFHHCPFLMDEQMSGHTWAGKHTGAPHPHSGEPAWGLDSGQESVKKRESVQSDGEPTHPHTYTHSFCTHIHSCHILLVMDYYRTD